MDIPPFWNAGKWDDYKRFLAFVKPELKQYRIEMTIALLVIIIAAFKIALRSSP